MYRRLTMLLLVGLGGGLIARQAGADSRAQVLVTSTPARITIPTVTPIATMSTAVTAAPSSTPTPRGAVMLQAKEFANVRAAPDIEAEKLGTIRTGELYPVIGRSFRWLQFQYEPSPSGTGWVYDDLVDIVGDPNAIVDLNANTLPTVDTSTLNITQTWEAITQTPGGLLTATADARFIQPPPGADGSPVPDTGANLTGPVLPTYTYPPDILAQAPTPGPASSTAQPKVSTQAASGTVAPIVPIVVLGGLGLLGLIFSSMRK